MKKTENYVSASILSGDMLNLASEVKKMEKSNVDMLHFDVMDGVFVNNITYGLPILKCIREITDLTLDVHLMITDPLKYIDAFAEFGADIICFHLESKSDPEAVIEQIKKNGVKSAIAIKPLTPASEVFKYLHQVDMVLVMTVEPGFGGQKFISDTLEKIVEIKKYIDDNNLETNIQVDGGIDNITCDLVKKSGANILVSGSYLFKSENMLEVTTKLKEDFR